MAYKYKKNMFFKYAFLECQNINGSNNTKMSIQIIIEINNAHKGTKWLLNLFKTLINVVVFYVFIYMIFFFFWQTQ